MKKNAGGINIHTLRPLFALFHLFTGDWRRHAKGPEQWYPPMQTTELTNPCFVLPRPGLQRRIVASVSALALLLVCTSAVADNVDELVALYRIQEDLQAQHQQCLDGAALSLEMDLESAQQSQELDIAPGDPDWALLGAIYSEYFAKICSYLEGEEILNFYRSEIRKRFTAAEIDTLIEFNKTPLGRKVNAEWLNINRVYTDILNERQALDAFDAQQRFDSRMDDFWEYRQNKANEGLSEQDV